MSKVAWFISSTLLGTGVCVAFILAAIYPLRPADGLGWTVLIVIAVPIVLGLELIGTDLLQNRFVLRMSRAGRIAYGVIALIVISALLLFAWRWAVPHLATW